MVRKVVAEMIYGVDYETRTMSGRKPSCENPACEATDYEVRGACKECDASCCDKCGADTDLLGLICRKCFNELAERISRD